MKSGIIWLASYPKSGNTWLRIFLTNLRRGGEAPANINDLDGGPIASARTLFDEMTGIEASDLTAAEIDRLRPEVYERLAAEAKEVLFLKVHDAYTYAADGRPLLAATGSRAIYLIRNPLDVAVAFANHASRDLDTVIDRMGDEGFALAAGNARLADQLRQRLLTWSAHVLSWLAAPIPVKVLRYEDMKQQPQKTFAEAAQFAGLPDDPARVRKAVEFSDFRELQRQEQECGFRERPPETERFFREDGWGAWRRELTPAQAARIIRDHREVMQQFGYLTANGEPVF
ncbi:MAG TPA: sulfotransferase [Desulfobacterales bacterium]|nr:sulfotransferase [Desulfobacterales bacterium]